MRFLLTNPVAHMLFSGALLLGAFYVPHAWWLVFVALIPFFFALVRAQNRFSAFFLGMLHGSIMAGGTSFWYFSATPIVTEMGPITNFLLILACWLAMVIALSPTTGLFALGVYSLPRTRQLGYFVVPLAWILFEFLRMYAFLIVTYAPGVENPAFYSTGFIGYPLADSSSWLQLASPGGIYLMSFVVVGINYLLFRLVLNKKYHSVRFAGTVFLVLGGVSILPIVQIRETFSSGDVIQASIGIMSVSIPEEELRAGYKATPEFMEKIQAGVKELVSDGAELVLLPEGSRFLTLTETGTVQDSVVVDVIARKTPYGVLENVAYAGTPEGSVINPVRAKSIVTPQGEYVIGLAGLVAPLFGYERKVEEIADKVKVSTARWGTSVSLPGSSLQGSLIFCIEMISPWFGALLAKEQQSDFLLVTISQGRFRNPYSLGVDTLRFLKVRAVEAGRPILSSADHAQAYAIDEYGRLLHELGERGATEYQVVELEVQKK